jgi:hypothetical protein
MKKMNTRIMLFNQNFKTTKSIAFLLFFGILSLFYSNIIVAQTTYYSRGTGNWNAAVWSTSTNGTATSATITASDNVVIQASDNITLNVTNAVCAKINLGNSNAIATLTFNFGSQLTVSGTVTLGNASSNNQRGSVVMTNGGKLICNGLALGNAGTNTFTPGAGTVELNSTNTIPSTIFTSFNILNTTSGTTTLGAGVSINTLNIGSGTTLTPGANLITLTGDFVNSGTMTSGSGGMTLTGTINQSINGFTTTGLISMTKTGGTATFTGNISGAGLTINGTGGTLNLGASLSHTFSGLLTRTAGTLNGGSSTITLSNLTPTSGTGGTFTAGTGTVEYSGAGNQTIGV